MKKYRGAGFYLLLMLGIFTLGIAIGAIYSAGMGKADSDEVYKYLYDFFENNTRSGMEIFLTSFFDNLKLFFIIFIALFYSFFEYFFKNFLWESASRFQDTPTARRSAGGLEKSNSRGIGKRQTAARQQRNSRWNIPPASGAARRGGKPTARAADHCPSVEQSSPPA